MKLLLFFLGISIGSIPGWIWAQSAPPELSSWIQNMNGATGYGAQSANVQSVQYSDSSVYVGASDIPAYTIGPWHGDPNVPSDQHFIFRFPRFPEPNAGTAAATPLGHIALLVNGVSIFNPKDGNTYLNDGVWNQNAAVVEQPSFDACGGHAQQNGEYHYHVDPVCLYTKDSTRHSPILGYAFDGYPIYGPYGYSNPDGSGGIRRMSSSYHLRSITERTSLPDGTVLSASQDGPAVSAQYPLGYYLEDYAYTAGSGDLDEHNGRFCITPEYPQGTYAYFVTIDSIGNPMYPYFIGQTYYGTVVSGDIGPQGGHVTIPGTVQTYLPNSGVAEAVATSFSFTVSPNPATNSLRIEFAGGTKYPVRCELFNGLGIRMQWGEATERTLALSLQGLPEGMYFVVATTPSGSRYLMPALKQ